MGYSTLKKKGGGYSEVPYERMICVCIKKRNLMPLIVVFTSILKFRVKWRYTLSFMFVLCIFKDDGWPIFLWPWSVLIHKLSTPLSWFLFNFTGGFWVTLAVMHVEDCLWRGIIALFVWRYWLLLLFYKIHGLSDVLLHYSIGKHCLWLMCLVWCFLMRGKS